MKRPVQHFHADYLKNCSKMSAQQIVTFLEQFRQLHAATQNKKRLISLRISETLLAATKFKAEATGISYQTQIQRLIEAWVKS